MMPIIKYTMHVAAFSSALSTEWRALKAYGQLGKVNQSLAQLLLPNKGLSER